MSLLKAESSGDNNILLHYRHVLVVTAGLVVRSSFRVSTLGYLFGLEPHDYTPKVSCLRSQFVSQSAPGDVGW